MSNIYNNPYLKDYGQSQTERMARERNEHERMNKIESGLAAIIEELRIIRTKIDKMES
ncbi:hypothetical protein HNQ80_004265 [Anaerosolibacter carboniphilus]|uniref:Uncharacterized protein n=1 Tax=Anaerosolibacter carboniphilus TaxID=1417629 RepID=A0A841L780_9FIRM|nr:hypothetical protein [Anaerosolibacter carboniphilus]MBB6218125.1 hypothetical protein [Anaerosolibacter carboniphilus]